MSSYQKIFIGFVPYQSAKNGLINKHTKDTPALEDIKTSKMLSSPTLQLNLTSRAPRSRKIFDDEENFEQKDDERIVNKLQLMELKNKRNIRRRRKNLLVRIHFFLQILITRILN